MVRSHSCQCRDKRHGFHPGLRDPPLRRVLFTVTLISIYEKAMLSMYASFSAWNLDASFLDRGDLSDRCHLLCGHPEKVPPNFSGYLWSLVPIYCFILAFCRFNLKDCCPYYLLLCLILLISPIRMYSPLVGTYSLFTRVYPVPAQCLALA